MGDAYSLIGSERGFLHNRIADTDGTCIDDPAGSPLNVSRIPLNPPACTGNDLTSFSPNPCLATVSETRIELRYDNLTTCQVPSEPADRVELVTVPDAPAIRLRTPAMTLNLAAPFSTGDAQCNGDRQGTFANFAPTFRGIGMTFDLIGGFFPLRPVVDTTYPTRLVRGPIGQLWIVDIGDVITQNVFANGQLVRFNPADLENDLVVIR